MPVEKGVLGKTKLLLLYPKTIKKVDESLGTGFVNEDFKKKKK